MAQTRVQHDARNESEQPTEPVQVPGAFSSREGRTAVSSPASNQSSRCQRSERRKIAYPPMKARKVCAEESFFQGTTMQAPTTAVIMHPRSMLIRFGNVTLKSFAADAELAVVFFLAALAPRNQKSCHDQLARIKRESVVIISMTAQAVKLIVTDELQDKKSADRGCGELLWRMRTGVLVGGIRRRGSWMSNGLDHDRYILGAIGVLDSKPEHGKNSTTYSRKVCEIVSERGSKATKKGVWSLAPVAPLGTMGMATQDAIQVHILQSSRLRFWYNAP
ncbi:uncharacterized protein L3040_005083 [Drepanopeziza brunnea f. sp. 'multigermtubi']|uniref:uncharacterized protein n=1 Tax=Drepanopeziza brunnea f. sp. 'multigermtubi' TaxID=698441 RepID=UPI00239EFF99|nr:hypothetical protein L3040_005083 [Drepanopeziza brunnea f. sp. 'multigermtubi']